MRSEKQIPIKFVLERFKADGSRPTSYYLGVESEDLRPAADKMVLKLKGLGVLDEQENEVEPFTPEVVGAFGIDYDILNEEVENKMKRDLGVITGTLTGGKRLKEMDPDEMTELVKDPVSTMRYLEQHNPRDQIVWVAKVLARQKKDGATLDEWFFTRFLFDKLAKAKSLELLGKGMEVFKYFSEKRF